MSEILREPVIPEVFQPYWDEKAQEVHERYRSYSGIREFMRGMPEPKMCNLGVGPVEFVDMSPTEDHDREHAIVVDVQHAMGWSPALAIKLKQTQDSLKVPTRMIVFLENAHIHNWSYSTNASERDVISAGDNSPIAERRLGVLQKNRVITADFNDYSLGCAIGAKTVRLAAEHGHIEVRSGLYIEPVNNKERPPGEVGSDFRSTGITALNKAINESAIPILSKAQRSRGGLDTLMQLGKFAKFGLVTSLVAQNRANLSGMGHDEFGGDLDAALNLNPVLRTLVVAGNDSLLAGNDEMAKLDELLSKYGDRAAVEMVDGYGHEIGDNTAIYVTATKKAIEG